jgi:hypothetical protein
MSYGTDASESLPLHLDVYANRRLDAFRQHLSQIMLEARHLVSNQCWEFDENGHHVPIERHCAIAWAHMNNAVGRSLLMLDDPEQFEQLIELLVHRFPELEVDKVRGHFEHFHELYTNMSTYLVEPANYTPRHLTIQEEDFEKWLSDVTDFSHGILGFVSEIAPYYRPSDPNRFPWLFVIPKPTIDVVRSL